MDEQKNTLLIVDDEKNNLKLLTFILGAEYTIYTAASGENAIEKAKEYIPDLILLDILMPGMDGYETLSELKKIPKTQKIPVIFITGLSSSEDIEKGLSLAADYISKPFSAMIVKSRVRNQIQMVNQLRTIERLSIIDQLTNIPNRRSFDEHLRSEWNRAIREQKPISILLLDVDKFKDFNDTYGYQQGDVALQTVANVLSRLPTGFAARWRGEEFVILLSSTPLAAALDIAEKIRADIENEEIPRICNACISDARIGDANTTIKVTASIGVNTQVPAQVDSVDAFISSADRALYAAKEAGRNRVTASMPS